MVCIAFIFKTIYLFTALELFYMKNNILLDQVYVLTNKGAAWL